jgi:transcriptional regulator with XRE-family HTH domain
VVEKLRESLHAGGLQQRQIAARLKVSKQFLSAVVSGKKRCPDELKRRLEKYLARHTKPSPGCTARPVENPQFELVPVQVKKGSATLRKADLDYYDRGLCVIPIRSWEVSRKPFVKWAQFQNARPTRRQVIDWWTDAGIAVILGPVSNLLCADVDGEQAHRILLDLLGEIPLVPTCKSGSDDPYR